MAMAETLLERIHDDGVALKDNFLDPLRRWFGQVDQTEGTSRELSAELKTVAEGGGGIPGLIKLLGTFTAAFKTGSSQKSEWRRDIRNDFTSLAAAFNTLIHEAEQTLAHVARPERVLFLVDGTDKMRGEDTQQSFVQDAEQLLAIETLVIYTAPLDLKYDGRLGGKLDADIVLPMIKLQERDDCPCEVGLQTMRQLLLLRADRRLFASDAEVDRLVAFSGGHPRELLRLLKLCCEVADESIDADSANGGNDKRAQDLLQRLALLQYNDGTWRRSHPVARTMEGYKLAAPPSGEPSSGHAADTSA